MVFSVRNVQRFAVQRHALRSIESRSIEWTVIGTVRASAYRFDQHTVQLSDHDSIVVRVGDEESIVLFVSNDFSGKGEGQIANLCALQHKLQRCFI